MSRVFSNGLAKDYVINPFRTMAHRSDNLWIAAPFVTTTEDLLNASKQGKSVFLLAGLNASTTPEALKIIYGAANCEVRYYTDRFHAKIFLFDNEALLGSSNLTRSGLQLNREATIIVDRPEDLDEVRSLFNELWENARILTPQTLENFANKWEAVARKKADIDGMLENAVGKAEPPNVNVASTRKTAKEIFLESLRRLVSQYRNSFNEVTSILENNNFRRPELDNVGIANETNRFLNWVRVTYAPGEDAWQSAIPRPEEERRDEIIRLGREWVQTPRSQIPEDYVEWLLKVRSTFGSREAIEHASKDDISAGLTSIHAFSEQHRFVTDGGQVNLAAAFWKDNNEDLEKVKRTLIYLVYGTGEFSSRLHDILYDPARKLAFFGRFCAMEMYGTIKPEDCPPINGRMAKALRFLGFNVRGN
jgi:PLD-like domain